ncbi:MAG: hypothetical protein JO176_04920 [Acidimicrobiia bacterium]|nr:hypothetical protein [Acidimicrobiia bacterium]
MYETDRLIASSTSPCGLSLSPRLGAAVPFAVARHLVRNVAALATIAAILLTIFESSHHRIAVLPGDASPLPVLIAAIVIGVAITVAEERFRSYFG